MAAEVVVAAKHTVGGAVFIVVVEFIEILDELRSLAAVGVAAAAMTGEHIKADFVHMRVRDDTTTELTRGRFSLLK